MTNRIFWNLEEMFKYESGLDIDVYVAKSATNAVRLLEKIKFDVVMTDIKMPGMNGIELFKLIKRKLAEMQGDFSDRLQGF